MSFTDREFWAFIHGFALGGLFLLSFTGGFVGLWSLRTRLVTAEGLAERVPRLGIWTGAMAVVSWLTVVTGTWIVYPWYRATPPEGTTDLSGFPRSLLLSSPSTAEWHHFAMEWKEHVAWLAPFLATVVAFAVVYYGAELARNRDVRGALLVFFTLAFAAAGVAGLFGALITKVAAV